MLPVGYVLTATPYMWLADPARLGARVVGGRASRSPGGYSFGCGPTWSFEFLGSLLQHWFLPFLSLFLVAFGGWAIGMRNLIIYELEADYANYLEALGAPRRLVRRYAFRNALLPQITGLALQLGRAGRRRAGHRDRLLLPGPRLPDPAGDPEPGLLPAPGRLPVHRHRRAGGQLHHRHRLRPGRPAHPDRDAEASERRHDPASRHEVLLLRGPQPQGCVARAGRGRSRVPGRWRLVGPLFTDHGPNEYVGPPAAAARRPSTGSGTTTFGQDVFAQFVHGLRSTFLVGVLGGGLAALIGMTIGFTAGYRGGLVDEVLNMLTNVVLVIPTLAVLHHRRRLPGRAQRHAAGALHRAHLLAVGGAGGPGADVLAGDARLRRPGPAERDAARWQIILREIAPNMSSYLLMTFILLFGGAVLIAATLDFIGLGPTERMSLGLMMNNAVHWSALQLGHVVVVRAARRSGSPRSSARST